MDSTCRIANENNGYVAGENYCPEENYQEVPMPVVAQATSQNDFKRTRLVGEGSFGKVYQVARHNHVFAMKVVNKIGDPQEEERLNVERYILLNNQSPFLCHMFQWFETPEKVYFVMEFLYGGDLHSLIEKETCLAEEVAMFYLAQILLALEHLHDHWVVYRDLKPCNIMIDHRGYIKLTDFGMCKLDLPKNETTSTFCGTLEFNAPEQIRKHDYDHSVDMWALGVTMYIMIIGREPFHGETKHELMKDIVRANVKIPKWVTANGNKLLRGLLTKAPEKRLSIPQAKGLRFFAGLDWGMMVRQEYEAPLRPIITDPMDVSNFDHCFTSQAVQQSPVKGDPFEGFDYEPSK